MKINLNTSIGIILLMTSCSRQIQVKTDYDREINFSLYKTYSWLAIKDIEAKNNPLIYNELTDKRIRKAVDNELKNKGIKYATVNPDLRLHYHIIVENKSMIIPERYGYNYTSYWISNQWNTYQYQQGTLIIDLMNAKNNNLVWRGWGSSALEDNDVDMSETEIDHAVKKILSKYPPKK